jgi:hypothetical protein
MFLSDETFYFRKSFTYEAVNALQTSAIRHKSIEGGFSKLDIYGWSKEAISNFCSADEIIVTLPHASPNIFFPRVLPNWYAKKNYMTKNIVHLRIVLDHTNFGDLGWRPYRWWYLDKDKCLKSHSMFTRNKKKKHVIVSSQKSLSASDNFALTDYGNWLPLDADNLAESYIGMMARDETKAGLVIKDRTLYIPLSIAIKSIAAVIKQDSTIQRTMWLRNLFHMADWRCIGSDKKLHDSLNINEQTVMDNYSMIAALGSLGNVSIIGGNKMQDYWKEVINRSHQADIVGNGMPFTPTPVNCFSGIQLTPPFPSKIVMDQLTKEGINYSQGLAISEHGAFASH